VVPNTICEPDEDGDSPPRRFRPSSALQKCKDRRQAAREWAEGALVYECRPDGTLGKRGISLEVARARPYAAYQRGATRMIWEADPKYWDDAALSGFVRYVASQQPGFVMVRHPAPLSGAWRDWLAPPVFAELRPNDDILISGNTYHRHPVDEPDEARAWEEHLKRWSQAGIRKWAKKKWPDAADRRTWADYLREAEQMHDDLSKAHRHVEPAKYVFRRTSETQLSISPPDRVAKAQPLATSAPTPRPRAGPTSVRGCRDPPEEGSRTRLRADTPVASRPPGAWRSHRGASYSASPNVHCAPGRELMKPSDMGPTRSMRRATSPRTCPVLEAGTTITVFETFEPA